MHCHCGGTGWLPTAVATAAAIAALLSVWFSRQSVERSHRPYVWPEWMFARVEDESYDDDEALDADDDEEAEARANAPGNVATSCASVCTTMDPA